MEEKGSASQRQAGRGKNVEVGSVPIITKQCAMDCVTYNFIHSSGIFQCLCLIFLISTVEEPTKHANKIVTLDIFAHNIGIKRQ